MFNNQICNDMIELLKQGFVIEIKHPTNHNYTPTIFQWRNGKIWFFNMEAGTGEHPTIQTNKAINKHIRSMLNEGFDVRITKP